MNYKTFEKALFVDGNYLIVRNTNEIIATHNIDNKLTLKFIVDELFYVDGKELVSYIKINKFKEIFKEDINPERIIRYLDRLVNNTYYEYEIEQDYLRKWYYVGYNGENKHVVFPSIYDGKDITGISEIENNNIESIEIENGIEIIKYKAFINCENLKKVKFGEAIKKISYDSFNTKIVECEVENSMIYLNDWLIDVIDNGMDDYIIRKGTLGIADRLFDEKIFIKFITFPNSLKYFDEYIESSKIQCIKYQGTIEEFKKLDEYGLLSKKYEILTEDFEKEETDKFTFYKDKSKNIYSVSMKKDALYGDVDLQKELPNYVIKSLANRGFAECKEITSINLPDTIERIGNECFEGCGFLFKVKLPKYLEIINAETFKDCTVLKEIELPDELIGIGYSAFFKCKNLKLEKLPEKLTYIERRAFSRCNNMNKISLNENLNYVGPEVFASCKYLIEIIFNSKIQRIGQGFAYNCVNLEKVYLPYGLTKIYDSAFERCENLKEVHTRMTEKEWGKVINKGLDIKNIDLKFID